MLKVINFFPIFLKIIMLAFNISRMYPCYQIDRAGEQLKTDKTGKGSGGGEEENDRERGAEVIEERKDGSFLYTFSNLLSDNVKP